MSGIIKNHPDFPLNIIHIDLAHRDSRLLTSPDGQRIEVSLAAVRSALCESTDHLRAEVKRLRGKIDTHDDIVKDLRCERDEALKEIERLKAKYELGT